MQGRIPIRLLGGLSLVLGSRSSSSISRIVVATPNVAILRQKGRLLFGRHGSSPLDLLTARRLAQLGIGPNGRLPRNDTLFNQDFGVGNGTDQIAVLFEDAAVRRRAQASIDPIRRHPTIFPLHLLGMAQVNFFTCIVGTRGRQLPNRTLTVKLLVRVRDTYVNHCVIHHHVIGQVERVDAALKFPHFVAFFVIIERFGNGSFVVIFRWNSRIDGLFQWSSFNHNGHFLDARRWLFDWNCGHGLFLHHNRRRSRFGRLRDGLCLFGTRRFGRLFDGFVLKLEGSAILTLWFVGDFLGSTKLLMDWQSLVEALEERG
jgi:hypothetical protein